MRSSEQVGLFSSNRTEHKETKGIYSLELEYHKSSEKKHKVGYLLQQVRVQQGDQDFIKNSIEKKGTEGDGRLEWRE